MLNTYSLIGIEHLDFIIFAAGRCSPNLFTGSGWRAFFTIFWHRIITIFVIYRTLIATIPSSQIAIKESSRLFQETSSAIRPISCASIVYFFGDNSNVCGIFFKIFLKKKWMWQEKPNCFYHHHRHWFRFPRNYMFYRQFHRMAFFLCEKKIKLKKIRPKSKVLRRL